jgi:hypothetical protein
MNKEKKIKEIAGSLSEIVDVEKGDAALLLCRDGKKKVCGSLARGKSSSISVLLATVMHENKELYEAVKEAVNAVDELKNDRT